MQRLNNAGMTFLDESVYMSMNESLCEMLRFNTHALSLSLSLYIQKHRKMKTCKNVSVYIF
jgi:hypothetical protein